MRQYLPRSWISPKLKGAPSRIHGDGIVATGSIACGEKLMEFGGEIISVEQANGDLYREQSVWMVSDDIFLGLRVSDPEESLDENLNHSCDANTWLIDEVTVVARRNIAAGEEITLDQGTWNFSAGEYTWDDALCGCGAADCRKTLTEDDWQLPVVQQRYAGHLHPTIQKMIDQQTTAVPAEWLWGRRPDRRQS